MKQLHKEIAEAQLREGVRVIKPAHALGFLDPDLPPLRHTLKGLLKRRDLPRKGSGIRTTLPAAAKTRLVSSSAAPSTQNVTPV